MKLPRCVHCKLAILELEGQFSKLDSLYIQNGQPPPHTAGWWHARCLGASDVGPLWFEARLRNFRDVRHYEEVARYPHWTVLRDPNRSKVLAFGRHGELLNLSRGRRNEARTASGGWIFPKLDEVFHLELDDDELAQRIKDALVATGSFPLAAILEAMGVASRTVHPAALERGVLRFDKGLQAHWVRGFVSASAEYGVYVPIELEPHVGVFIR
jgi:hypothetical protein